MNMISPFILSTKAYDIIKKDLEPAIGEGPDCIWDVCECFILLDLECELA